MTPEEVRYPRMQTMHYVEKCLDILPTMLLALLLIPLFMYVVLWMWPGLRDRAKKNQEADMNTDAVHMMRECAMDALGFNCTFVDDNMTVIAGLAQRAVLAGLDADCKDDMRRRFAEAAERSRKAHEKALGFPITRISP